MSLDRQRMVLRLAVTLALLPTALAVQTPPCHNGASVNQNVRARAATTEELRIFRRFAPSSRLGWKINEWAVAGPWALIGYYNEYAGVTAFFRRNAAGNWIMLGRGGGQIMADTMMRYDPCMSAKVADALYALAASQDRP